LGQLAIHAACMLAAVRMATSLMGEAAVREAVTAARRADRLAEAGEEEAAASAHRCGRGREGCGRVVRGGECSGLVLDVARLYYTLSSPLLGLEPAVPLPPTSIQLCAVGEPGY
jgi:hypothetical protein